MNDNNEELRPFHEVVPKMLKSLVFHFKSEKADFAFGAAVTSMGMLRKTIIPDEHVPEIIKACDFVNQALELLEEDDVPDGLKKIALDTLEELRGRLPKS